MEKELDYYFNEGLDQYSPQSERPVKEDVFAGVRGDPNNALAADIRDLVRLHKLIRSRKSFTVLEFGTGHSTKIMADAIMKNERDWNALAEKPQVRNSHMFRVFTVDSSEQWLKHSETTCPDNLKKYISFSYSTVSIGTFNGQLCHYYDRIPDIIPDFVYLDGPDPKHVQGDVRGMTFQCDERTVMAGDLLLMEPTLLPGTFIIVDGRTNNCRFLMNNFKRKYKVNWDKEGDVTTFELDEERLGKLNVLGSDFF